MPIFPLAGEPLLCSFCFFSVGPLSLKVQRASLHLQGPEPQDYFSSTCRAGEGFAAFVLQRYSSLWFSFSVGKLLIKSKLDPLYMMAKFDGRAQF